MFTGNNTLTINKATAKKIFEDWLNEQVLAEAIDPLDVVEIEYNSYDDTLKLTISGGGDAGTE